MKQELRDAIYVTGDTRLCQRSLLTHTQRLIIVPYAEVMAHVPASSTSYPIRRKPFRHHWTTSFSRDLQNFVVQLLPSIEELAVKEDVRKLLERLIRTIEPDSRLLSFGSTANGFSLRNSDMDLCCLIDSGRPPLNSSDLVTMVGDLLERETKFKVKTLPHARIPIIKLSLDPSPGFPYGISSDIGFENRLALENTRLLMSYASIDPLRVRTLVIFLKVWSKRRKINSPYSGTLSSYGYALLVIYFLVHVKNPPVLPNLQQMPPLRPISHEETHIGSHNIWFFDDIDLLRQRWQSSNTDSVADLLIDFFKYFSREFSYNTCVVSIRAGLLKKASKGWQSDDTRDSTRDRNRFCIEDPFEIDYNVARCVTKDGLYTIRGEFMRASRILAARPERTIMALAQLCEERDVEFVRPLAPQPFVPPRMATTAPQSLHVQTVTQGLDSLPPTIFESFPSNASDSSPAAGVESFDSSLDSKSPSSSPVEAVLPQPRDPPAHMAPRRAQWTSPPPPDDPDRIAYESRLGAGLTLATASTVARKSDRGHSGASSSSSEILTDEDHEKAELESVGSFASADGTGALTSTGSGSISIGQGSSMRAGVNLGLSHSFPKPPLSFFGPPELSEYPPQFAYYHGIEVPPIEATEDDADGWLVISTPRPVLPSATVPGEATMFGDTEDFAQSNSRGRPALRFGFVAENSSESPKPPHHVLHDHHRGGLSTPGKTSDSPRRSSSGPPAPRARIGGKWANFTPAPSLTSIPHFIPDKNQPPSRTDMLTSIANTIDKPAAPVEIADTDASSLNSGSNSPSSSIIGLNSTYRYSPPSLSSSIRTPFPLYQTMNPALPSATPYVPLSNSRSNSFRDVAQIHPLPTVVPSASTIPDANIFTMSGSPHDVMPLTSGDNVPPSSTSPISLGTACLITSDRVISRPDQENDHVRLADEPHQSHKRYSDTIPISLTQQFVELQRANDATPTPKSPKLNGTRMSTSPKNTHTTINSNKDKTTTVVQSPSKAVQAAKAVGVTLEAASP